MAAKMGVEPSFLQQYGNGSRVNSPSPPECKPPMTFLELCESEGPAARKFQVGLIKGMLAQYETFLLIQSGQPNTERERVADYRRQGGVDESIPCFSIDAIDEHLAWFDAKDLAAFRNGSVLQSRPRQPQPTEAERLTTFFTDMLEPDHNEAVLLPSFAVILRRVINGDIALGSIIDFDLVRAWRKVCVIGRRADMDACCAEVMTTGYPLLLWFFPDHDSQADLRLMARRVDHWIVPPAMMASSLSA